MSIVPNVSGNGNRNNVIAIPNNNIIKVQSLIPSKFDLEEFVFRWKVNVSSFKHEMTTRRFESPVFVGGVKSSGHSWQLLWRPGGLGITVKLIPIGEFPLYPHYIDFKNTRVFIWFKDPEIGNETQPQRIYQYLGPQKQAFCTLGWNHIHFQDLFSESKGYLSDGCITIHCKILVGVSYAAGLIGSAGIILSGFEAIPPSSHHDEVKGQGQSQSQGQSSTDLKNQNFRKFVSAPPSLKRSPFISSVCSSPPDAQVICETKIFPVHKDILIAQSPVFAEMLISNCHPQMPKSTQGAFNPDPIEITEFNELVVGSMLDFMYTGQFSQILYSFMYQDLFRIADKFKILKLKVESERFLRFNLDVESAVDLFVMASSHNAHALKLVVLQFIAFNIDELSKLDSFKNLKLLHPLLAHEIKLYVKNKEPFLDQI